MAYLHAVNGDHAADLLNDALTTAGRDDRVVCLRDDLAVGPIEGIDEDPGARVSFWQTVLDNPERDLRKEFEAQAAALAELAHTRMEVVVWHGLSAADQLMLRRVAFHLRNAPQRLNEVGLTLREADPARIGPGKQIAVGHYSPDILRARFPTIVPIPVLRISRLALEWQEVKRVNSEVRRLTTNTFARSSFHELDALIIEHVTAERQPLNHLVSEVMRANTGFLATDVLVLWRIRTLADAGRLSLRGKGKEREIALPLHENVLDTPR
ncbi:DUF1835 domain-containing protein [Pararobbsia alpina]|uniref:DUF1835 domain-containing protein n=1 Tax=Pararobbsia alpina TaxID=621374 RepID=A0A6S7BKC4_9BURK|nr:DUF1835 domain-containing protein [Pararobbsia alpina]CAB3803448.1 hypothetical protein LMG28138_05355 [Pararobbsia alpina]